ALSQARAASDAEIPRAAAPARAGGPLAHLTDFLTQAIDSYESVSGSLQYDRDQHLGSVILLPHASASQQPRRGLVGMRSARQESQSDSTPSAQADRVVSVRTLGQW